MALLTEPPGICCARRPASASVAPAHAPEVMPCKANKAYTANGGQPGAIHSEITQVAAINPAFHASTRAVSRMASHNHPTTNLPVAFAICTTVSIAPAASRLMSNTLTQVTTV